jgi:redox-sensitive bicupin YhaK (pirin superfamily)
LKGEVQAEGDILGQGDSLALTGVDELNLIQQGSETAQVMLFDLSV